MDIFTSLERAGRPCSIGAVCPRGEARGADLGRPDFEILGGLVIILRQQSPPTVRLPRHGLRYLGRFIAERDPLPRVGLRVRIRLPPAESQQRTVRRPRISPRRYRVIVELISATTTKTGLTVRCELDTGKYPSGIVVSDAEMAALNIKRAEFHGEWNYTISPNTHPPNHALIS